MSVPATKTGAFAARHAAAFLCSAALLLNAAPLARAAGGPYVFERVADTSGEIDSLDFGGQMYEEGEVTFFADMDGGDERIYRFRDGVLTPVATAPDAEFESLHSPDINNSGKLAFSFLPASGGSGVKIAIGPIVETLYDTNQLTHNLHIFSGAMVNDDGRVAFIGYVANVPGVYLDSDGPPAKLVDANGSFKTFALQDFHNDGRVVVQTELDNGTKGLYLLQPNAAAVKIADSAGPIDELGFARMNDDGVVAFTAIMDNGDFGIYSGTGGGLTTIADSTGDFEYTVLPQINDVGDIIFAAKLNSGPLGVYRGADPDADALIGDGDELDGSTMLALVNLCDMNNRGQFLFIVDLADGRRGLYIASPDADGDGTPDHKDECPDDAAKTESGLCGCGAEDFDTDEDGTPDACEPGSGDTNPGDGEVPGGGDTPGDGTDVPASGDCCGGGMPMMLPLLLAGLRGRRRSRRT